MSEEITIAQASIQSIELNGVGPYTGREILNLSPLTVLCGINGAGKSTWIKVVKIFQDLVDEKIGKDAVTLSQIPGFMGVDNECDFVNKSRIENEVTETLFLSSSESLLSYPGSICLNAIVNTDIRFTDDIHDDRAIKKGSKISIIALSCVNGGRRSFDYSGFEIVVNGNRFIIKHIEKLNSDFNKTSKWVLSNFSSSQGYVQFDEISSEIAINSISGVKHLLTIILNGFYGISDIRIQHVDEEIKRNMESRFVGKKR
jgi:hypothetical protein